MRGAPLALGLTVSEKEDGQNGSLGVLAITTALPMISLMLCVWELSVGGLHYPLDVG